MTILFFSQYRYEEEYLSLEIGIYIRGTRFEKNFSFFLVAWLKLIIWTPIMDIVNVKEFKDILDPAPCR